MAKPRLLLIFLFCLVIQVASGQFKYDNKLYHTVYLEDLANELRKSPDALLLDVRTPGEFNDTSQIMIANIGRLKNAKNIDYREFRNRVNELKEYKDKPLFIYCSHSARSRSASKILADSGFTNIININGGMSVFNIIKYANPQLNQLYETSNPYKILSPGDICKLMSLKTKLFILDIRSDSVFNGIAKDESLNAFGRLKGAINIPYLKLSNSLSKVPKNEQLLIVDDFGKESVNAAKLLLEKGFSGINILYNGMGSWASENNITGKEKCWIHQNKFGLISTEEFGEKLTKPSKILILDIRSNIEFNNQDTGRNNRNIGHIQNAINIPFSQLNTRLKEIENYKNAEVVVYDLRGDPESFESAKLLADNGFTKAKVLTDGLWGLLWKTANFKGLAYLQKFVVDVPER